MASKSDYWYGLGENSVLLNAVRNWREDSDTWLESSVDRLPETVRVNPLRNDVPWVEGWLEDIGGERLDWFEGVGSAWKLPFDRGKIEGEQRIILSSLHETGRLTRQEAVSMIPAIVLEAKPGEIILDMCASPGSKTTQISENLNNEGVVIANEIASSRINTLVSNSQRHGTRTCMIVNHDGRHFPKIPGEGFDRVLVDAPCTGSGTTRKNPEVWKKWLPSGGRSLHKLQIDLLSKAIDITKPGGRIVYSTCSLDPVENEAVIAEVMRKFPIKIIDGSELIKKLPCDRGFRDWKLLDDNGNITTKIDVPNSIRPPTEENIIKSMDNCMRIWNDKIDGGGFFIAVLEKITDNEISEPRRVVLDNQKSDDSNNLPTPINNDLKLKLINKYGSYPDNLWIRGKKILWATKETEYIWEHQKSRKSGRITIPGRRWKPIKVIHLGLDTIKLRNGEIDRIIGKAAEQIIPSLKSGYVNSKSELIDRLLSGEQPLPTEIYEMDESHRGSLILIDKKHNSCIPVWIGARVSLMINESERIVMRAKRGLKLVIDEEE